MFHYRARMGFERTIIAMSCLAALIPGLTEQAKAIQITVDYRYDTSNFFNTQQKRDPLEAAAARYSSIITTHLSAATLSDNGIDPRIGFTHPGTGASFQVSSAASQATDALIGLGAGAANEYRGPWTIAADQWILYAGGSPLASSAQGGTGTGTNITTVFTDGNSNLNRGFRASGSVSNLPVWGGAITFDNDGSTIWHYDLNTPASGSESDLYSIALHEIGHALGLSATWQEWTNFSSSGHFSGPNAVAAYNADNGASLSSLNEVSASNHHWQDGTYHSFIFPNGNPNYVSTVGPGVVQDLLMEPTANFTATVHRFELTNVDVAALRDIGWSTISQQVSGDINGDGFYDARDYVVWRKSNGSQAQYNAWRANFGSPGGAGSVAGPFAASIPEPASWLILTVGIAFAPIRFRRDS
jgi:hypothetical protein